MGDRALIVVHNGEGDISPAAYLHWGGHKVKDIIERALPRMRKSDVSYSFARLLGTAHEATPGALGLGCFNGPANRAEAETADYSPGDAGVFLLNCKTGLCECFNGYGFRVDGAEDGEMAHQFDASKISSQ